MAKTEKTEVSKNTYTFEYITYSDGSTTLNRTNDGFNLFELLGMIKIAECELLAILHGESNFKPDLIERKVYVNPKN